MVAVGSVEPKGLLLVVGIGLGWNGLRLAGAVVLVPKRPPGVEKGAADSGGLWLAEAGGLRPQGPPGGEEWLYDS